MTIQQRTHMAPLCQIAGQEGRERRLNIQGNPEGNGGGGGVIQVRDNLAGKKCCCTERGLLFLKHP